MVFLGKLKLPHRHRQPVFETGASGVFLPGEGGVDLLKNPGVAEHTAADHQSVRAGAFQAPYRRLAAGNIPVGNDGDGQLLLDLADGVPVGGAAVEHTPGAPVYRHHGRTAVLHAPGKVQHVDAALVPAQAAFNRDGHVHRFDHGLHDLPRQLRRAHQAAAVAVVRNLGHGAAHVDVQKITAGNFQRQPRPLRHGVRVVAENLCAADAARIFPKQFGAFGIPVHQRPGGHHFRHGDPRPQFGADGAESPVRDPGHGRKEHGVIHFDRSDSQYPHLIRRENSPLGGAPPPAAIWGIVSQIGSFRNLKTIP